MSEHGSVPPSQQTGVAYETLRRHYAKHIPTAEHDMWSRLDPSLRRERAA